MKKTKRHLSINIFCALFLLTFCCHFSWAIQEPEVPSNFDALQQDLTRLPTSAETRVTNIRRFKSIELPGNPKTKEQLEQSLREYIQNSPDVFGGLSNNELRLDYLSIDKKNPSGRRMAYANFIQTANGLDVEGGGFNVRVKLLPNGKTVIMGALGTVFPDLINFNPQPIGVAAAEQRVLQRLGRTRTAQGEKPKHIGKRVRWIEGAWHATQEFAEKGGGRVVVGENGKTWDLDDKIHINITGEVDGRAVMFDPGATGSNLNTLPMPNIKIMLNGDPAGYANSLGKFTIPNASANPITIGLDLSGRWVDVNNMDREYGGYPSFRGQVVPGTPAYFLFNPPPDDPKNSEFITSQVNAYLHTTVVHNYLVSRGVNLPGLRMTIPANVNMDDHCNAYYTRGVPSINFFKAGTTAGGCTAPSTCINTSFDTIIYHEYGHAVDDAAGGIPNTPEGRGLSEGWGDGIAVLISGQPKIGKGLFISGGPNGQTYVRTAENNYQYNPTDGVHMQGQAWAGFIWHLRQGLIASLGRAAGIALAEDLVIPSIMANPPTIPDAVVAVLIRDDDDGNLDNGTPHFNIIKDAAQAHGIFTGSSDGSSDGSSNDSSNGVDLAITAITAPANVLRSTTIAIPNTVTNQGSTSAPPSALGIYLSQDATITSRDTLLASRNINSLAPGQSSSAQTEVEITRRNALGTYYIGAIADYKIAVTESNEANNARAASNPTTISTAPPDIQMTAVSISPTTVVRGDNVGVDITFTMTNLGNELPGNFLVGYYLSTDATITTSDIFLKYPEPYYLYPGRSITVTRPALIPDKLSPGTYYVGTIADPQNQIAETNETNNSKAGNQITIIP